MFDVTVAKYLITVREDEVCTHGRVCEEGIIYIDLQLHLLALKRDALHSAIKSKNITRLVSYSYHIGYTQKEYLKNISLVLTAGIELYLLDLDQVLIPTVHLSLVNSLIDFKTTSFSTIINEKNYLKELIGCSQKTGRPTHNPLISEYVVEFRSEGLSYSEIAHRLEGLGHKVSRSSICRILKKARSVK